MTVDEALRTIRRMMKDSEYSFFMTHGPDGGIHARLMQHFEPESDLTLWFGAGPGSRKVHEITANRETTVSLMHPQHGGYVTLMGNVDIVTDNEAKKKYWRAHWTDIYPGGPENDQYLLLRFTPYRIELMDFADQDLPQPYGLKPIGLERTHDTWSVMSDRTDL